MKPSLTFSWFQEVLNFWSPKPKTLVINNNNNNNIIIIIFWKCSETKNHPTLIFNYLLSFDPLNIEQVVFIFLYFIFSLFYYFIILLLLLLFFGLVNFVMLPKWPSSIGRFSQKNLAINQMWKRQNKCKHSFLLCFLATYLNHVYIARNLLISLKFSAEFHILKIEKSQKITLHFCKKKFV